MLSRSEHSDSSRLRDLVLVLVLLMIAPSLCMAGGFQIRNPMLNGASVAPADRPVFLASSDLQICFTVSDYLYSGWERQHSHIVLLIAPDKPLNPAAVNSLPPDQIGVISAADGSLVRCHQAKVPPHEGSLVIYGVVIPYVAQDVLPPGATDATVATMEPAARAALFNFLRQSTHALLGFARFQVKASAAEPTEPAYTTYLRLNGKVPATQASIDGGLTKNPAVLSWFTTPKGPLFQYRYRVYPDELDWSPWGPSTESKVSFLPVGSHAFQVQTKYSDKQGHDRILPIALYQFFLEHPFVAAPSKGTGSGEPDHPAPPVVQYAASEALVLAVPKFGGAFFDLPFVTADAIAMKEVLTKRGFHVTAPSTVVRRQAILEAVGEFLNNAIPDSRVVIYLSTHGFIDPSSSTRNYLATADCDPKKPIGTCIPMTELERTILGLLEDKKIRHFLLVIDACASGMGVVTKTLSFPEAGTLHPGAHVITAGTAEEEARASNEGTMSVFTKYLVAGLEGKADTYQDGVITVSELLTYVRWNVATESQSAQTPMLGRLSGSGEMLFQLPPAH